MSSNDDLPESEVDFSSDKDYGINAWIVKPCEWYQQEYYDCKSIRGRVHQYFIFGQSIDCKHWKTDFDNCIQFRKTQNTLHLQNVIESELKRRKLRLKSSEENDVWKYRKDPPKDWLRPLPLWFLEQNKNSLFNTKQKEREKQKNNSKLNINQNL